MILYNIINNYVIKESLIKESLILSPYLQQSNNIV